MARPLRIESGPRPGAGRADALPRAAPAAIERGTVGRKFQRAGGEAGFGLVALRTDDRDAALAGRTVADGLLNAGEPGREVGGIQPGTRSAGNEEATSVMKRFIREIPVSGKRQRPVPPRPIQTAFPEGRSIAMQFTGRPGWIAR